MCFRVCMWTIMDSIPHVISQYLIHQTTCDDFTLHFEFCFLNCTEMKHLVTTSDIQVRSLKIYKLTKHKCKFM